MFYQVSGRRVSHWRIDTLVLAVGSPFDQVVVDEHANCFLDSPDGQLIRGQALRSTRLVRRFLRQRLEQPFLSQRQAGQDDLEPSRQLLPENAIFLVHDVVGIGFFPQIPRRRSKPLNTLGISLAVPVDAPCSRFTAHLAGHGECRSDLWNDRPLGELVQLDHRGTVEERAVAVSEHGPQEVSPAAILSVKGSCILGLRHYPVESFY